MEDKRGRIYRKGEEKWIDEDEREPLERGKKIRRNENEERRRKRRGGR